MENIHLKAYNPPNMERGGKGDNGSLENLIEREPMLQKALALAKRAHEGQTRDDGHTPYINHPIAVDRIMYEEWGITDPEILSAGLLHDTVEDTTLSLITIEALFGENVASLVDGVTKFHSKKETFKKLFGTTFLKPAVGIIKIADNLHNTRTLKSASNEKHLRRALETLNIYAPWAESLGMWVVKRELEDTAFQITSPKTYEKFQRMFNSDRRTQEAFILPFASLLKNLMITNHIDGGVFIRKNSIVRLKDKKYPFSDINDVISFRMIIKSGTPAEKRDKCYKLLGVLREEFKDQEDQSQFDDFFATPKSNEYSAIRMTVNTNGGPIEIAITTDEKEDYNNWGVVSLVRKGEKSLQKHILKLVFTPTGQVKFLKPEARGIDLAYLINPKMGAQATSMLIDGQKRPIADIIPNASDIEIKTGPERIAPNPKDVKNAQPLTKQRAQKQFLEEKMSKEEASGKAKVLKIISKRGLLDLYDLRELDEHAGKLGDLLNYSGSKRSLSTLYRLVEYGVISEIDLENLLDARGITKENLGLTSIHIKGSDEPGVLNKITTIVENHKGNIRINHGVSTKGKVFTQKLVVEQLGISDDNLKKLLQKDPRIKEIVIA